MVIYVFYTLKQVREQYTDCLPYKNFFHNSELILLTLLPFYIIQTNNELSQRKMYPHASFFVAQNYVSELRLNSKDHLIPITFCTYRYKMVLYIFNYLTCIILRKLNLRMMALAKRPYQLSFQACQQVLLMHPLLVLHYL